MRLPIRLRLSRNPKGKRRSRTTSMPRITWIGEPITTPRTSFVDNTIVTRFLVLIMKTTARKNRLPRSLPNGTELCRGNGTPTSPNTRMPRNDLRYVCEFASLEVSAFCRLLFYRRGEPLDRCFARMDDVCTCFLVLTFRHIFLSLLFPLPRSFFL